MLAVRLHEHGGPHVLALDSLPPPKPPGEGQVTVAMRAAGLNHLDLWVRNGLPGMRLPLPLTMGSDGAGTVLAVGQHVAGVAVGDDVVIQPGVYCGSCPACLAGRENMCVKFGILGETQDGVQTELAVVSAANVGPKPAALSFEEAASVVLVFMTAYQMLVRRANLRPGETVLVIGGSSGVGAAAIQIAAHLGARIIATAAAGAKTDFAREQGAHGVVDHYQENWYRQVLELAGADKVSVVCEHVGAATWDQSVRTMGLGARLVVCGATTGSSVTIDLRHVYRKQQTFLGSTMGDMATFQAVLRGFEAGDYRPFVDRVFPLAEIAAAHRYLEGSQQRGKVVVSMPADANS